MKFLASALAAALVAMSFSAAAQSSDEAITKKYFAYANISQPTKIHPGEDLVLSQERCEASGVPAGAKKAIYIARRWKNGCWAAGKDKTVLACRLGDDPRGPIGNDCVVISESRFFSTDSLPRGAF